MTGLNAFLAPHALRLNVLHPHPRRDRRLSLSKYGVRPLHFAAAARRRWRLAAAPPLPESDDGRDEARQQRGVGEEEDVSPGSESDGDPNSSDEEAIGVVDLGDSRGENGARGAKREYQPGRGVKTKPKSADDERNVLRPTYSLEDKTVPSGIREDCVRMFVKLMEDKEKDSGLTNRIKCFREVEPKDVFDLEDAQAGNEAARTGDKAAEAGDRTAETGCKTVQTGTDVAKTDGTPGRVGMNKLQVVHLGAVIESEDRFAPDMLFIRHDWGKILHLVRQRRHVVLFGNAGIGKSMFQYYYLLRMMNPGVFGELPEDIHGSQEPPSIVLRQVGDVYELYDLENDVAFLFGRDKIVLSWLDEKKAIHLYEPKQLREEPSFDAAPNHIIVCSCSPDAIRFKEFLKFGAKRIYMSVWSLEELLAILKHVRDVEEKCKEWDDVKKELYSVDAVTERFNQFGGMIRFCLPSDQDVVDEAVNSVNKAVLDVNAKALWQAIDLNNTDVSGFIAQYKVTVDGPNAYQSAKLEFVSDEIVRRLTNVLSAMDREEMVQILIRQNLFPAHHDRNVPGLYERLVAKDLVWRDGVKWWVRKNVRKEGGTSGPKKDKQKVSSENWIERREFRASGVHYGCVPYEKMDAGVLYYPPAVNFPLVDMFMKEVTQENGSCKLVGFQVTTKDGGKRSYDKSTVKKFAEKLGIAPETEVSMDMYAVVLPRDACRGDLQVENVDKLSVDEYIVAMPDDFRPDASEERPVCE